MVDLIHKHEREALAEKIKSDIDAYCARVYNGGHRNHLGASLIGHECSRYLWYVFRWVKSPQESGRMQRLFNRGHLEENRYIEWLRGIGFTVWDVADDGNQFRIRGVRGHYGGSLDGIGAAPDRYGELPPMLLEFKTHNTKSFVNLVNQGVKKAKPQHFAQMCQYGARFGFKYALYCPINKNDDDIAPEVIELDWGLGEDLERKAEDIITSQRPPVRFSETSTHFTCKFCPMLDICHNGADYERNCRSCAHATPIDDGRWHCALANDTIPDDFIPQGCGQWTPIGRS